MLPRMPATRRRRVRRKRAGSMASRADRYSLYQKSVQSPEHEVAFFRRVFVSTYGRRPRLLREDCKQLAPEEVRRRWWRVLFDTLAYHVTRRFPAWAGYLPAHSAPLKLAVPEGSHEAGESVWRPR